MSLQPRSQQVARKLRSHARWLTRARIDDYLLACCTVCASLPIVGRYLEPVGGMTAMSLWGTRYLPDFVTSARSRLAPGAATLRKHEQGLAGDAMAAGLRDVVAAEELDQAWSAEAGPPWRNAGRHRRSVYRQSVPYGNERGQVLDVWRPEELGGPAPVLVFVPGGAWVIGSRKLQGHALMAHLAAQGWVCLSVQYRTSPAHRWPRQIMDVKTAIAWARANADQFGGDRSFVAVAGCSAGGHMASLVGLTSDDQQWHDGLPASADTSVDAVVSIYGRYDWEDRSTPERARFMDFLERVVVKRRQSRHPELYRDASPMARLHPAAPPFLIIHGASDMIIPVGEARQFVEKLRKVSAHPVAYTELPGAGHGFDLVDPARTGAAVKAIGLFVNHIYRTRTPAVATAAV
jgi:acetyl esterase/lipase